MGNWCKLDGVTSNQNNLKYAANIWSSVKRAFYKNNNLNWREDREFCLLLHYYIFVWTDNAQTCFGIIFERVIKCTEDCKIPQFNCDAFVENINKSNDNVTDYNKRKFNLNLVSDIPDEL